MKRLCLIYCFILGFGQVYSQKNKTDGHVIWKEDRPLTWQDFRDRPSKNHFASAMSDIAFSVSVKTENSKLIVHIQPSFDPSGSWVKEEDKSDYLLNHEQVHFDIYEVNARKLRQELHSKKLTSSNVDSIVNRLVDKYQELNVKTQERYDEETQHSIKKEMQEKWNEAVREDLEKLAEFKAADFTLDLEMK